ncbi:MurR/RpiR family transcriptional regulator [Paralcaligenes sp. KSB-10]|jgi:DNA-binding MurR/RpiR family transcriptional regulator|uniref:MurR/RpiR family transcriptional regulator n=1 Tax=Paralcaligenes sp. KSB-10 TaxID=2901142 RepID=UPI001E62F3C6|nr:MurR/RpiR family transcriptional regulator [Paralcaligenes sp. KSB-10]UHL63809.1 MurR/RpiR family transcriptional regulator [Paralcaligenes sp. KSB-10]
MNENNPPQHLDELVALVQREFPRMTQQFQVGAKYLIDFPAEVPIASMRKIAGQAGVQPATLVRLAQHLGFEGWEPLKEVFVQSFRQTPKLYTMQARKVVRSKNPRTMVGKTLASQARNLALLDELNGERLPGAVDLLLKARRVHVAGFRSCFAPAFAFHYLYRLFRPSVLMLRGDAGTLEMEVRALDAADAVVVISFAPYSQEALQVAQAAHKAGCKVLAICDSVLAPMAHEADGVLLFSTETPSFFPSVAAAQALIEVLIEQLMVKSGKQAVSEIELAETQLHQTGAYL